MIQLLFFQISVTFSNFTRLYSKETASAAAQMKGGRCMEKDLLERLYREYYQAVFLYCLSLCGI